MKKVMLIIVTILIAATIAQADEMEIKVKITVGSEILTATFINNSTTQALMEKMPLTLPMKDLFMRELCHNFSKPLPANEVRRTGYDIGGISYWPPMNSFVIYYKQNGEVINLQKIGKIDSGVEIFEHTVDVSVRFELLQ